MIAPNAQCEECGRKVYVPETLDIEDQYCSECGEEYLLESYTAKKGEAAENSDEIDSEEQDEDLEEENTYTCDSCSQSDISEDEIKTYCKSCDNKLHNPEKIIEKVYITPKESPQLNHSFLDKGRFD